MGNKKIITLADDDIDMLNIISMILEDEGYLVQKITKAKDLFNMDVLPDLILLNVWLSGERGEGICEVLKANDRTRHIPVILVSAGREILESAWRAGADDFLAKPFETKSLTEVIKKHLPA